MKDFTESRTMPYTAKQLYDLAIDIESYPEFVPLCKRARLSEAVTREDGAIEFDSLLIFRFRKFGIYEEFESRITADPNQTTILSESEGPPFTSFKAKWSFVDTNPGEAKADFDFLRRGKRKSL